MTRDEQQRIAVLEAEVRTLKLMVKNLYTAGRMEFVVTPSYLTSEGYEEDIEKEIRAGEEEEYKRIQENLESFENSIRFAEKNRFAQGDE